MSITDKLSSPSPLGQVATVQPGYFARGRIESVPSGTHRLLQSRDVAEEGISVEGAATIVPQRNPRLYCISKGDILLQSRGNDHRAHLVNVDYTNTLASSVFYILRPDWEIVVPGFLAWWLNQSDVQAAIRSGSRGTGISYLSREHLEQIPVRLPSREVQGRIAETVTLLQRKQTLQTLLGNKHKLLVNALCRQAALVNKDL